MMTDPIADMLTRIRNSVRIERPFVDMPTSSKKVRLAQALQREGFIWDYELIENDTPQATLRVNLKYGPNGERVIQVIDRVSKPGCRVYVRSQDMVEVRDGLGVSILSTSKGVLSNREAKAQGVGGEVICNVW